MVGLGQGQEQEAGGRRQEQRRRGTKVLSCSCLQLLLLNQPWGDSSKGKSGWKPLSRLATYIRIAIQRIPSASTIQLRDQINAGIPVAFAMFTASVGTDGANGDERKKTVLRSKSALSTHWTARKLTKKDATRALENRAIKTRPTESKVPASSVNGIPDNAPHVSSRLNNP